MKKRTPKPFEADKTYTTKFQTGWHFHIQRIEKQLAYGIYLEMEHLGVCGLDLERILPEYEEVEVAHPAIDPLERQKAKLIESLNWHKEHQKELPAEFKGSMQATIESLKEDIKIVDQAIRLLIKNESEKEEIRS